MNNKYTIMYFSDWKERQVSDNMEKENVPPILYPEHISYIRENYPSLSVLEGYLSFYYTEQKGFSLKEWKKQMKEAIEYVFLSSLMKLKNERLEVMVWRPVLARHSSGLDFYFSPEDYRTLIKKVLHTRKITKIQRQFLRCICQTPGKDTIYTNLSKTQRFFNIYVGLKKQIGECITRYINIENYNITYNKPFIYK